MDAIGTLAGGIAHEFNNLLGIIIGNTELALSDLSERHPTRFFLEEIHTASIRAKDVVRRIMNFSRKQTSERSPIQVCDNINECLKLIHSTIPMTFEIHEEILCKNEIIHANPTEIHQILLNLCNNAVYAMQDETGVMKVRLEKIILDDQAASEYEDLISGEYVRLIVKDNGTGIAPEIIDRIFDPYFTTKEVDEGLGMGLAVVYGIVKSHAGAIRVLSDVGKGTSVEILFPISENLPDKEVVIKNELASGKERILFVDDERALVNLVVQVLNRHGYKVIGKSSSVEALEVFKAAPDDFDLIITDTAMPDIPGYRLAQEAFKHDPDIPIILCTGYSDRMDEEKAKELGIAAFILKPYEMNGLKKTVRKVLNDTRVKFFESSGP